MVNTISGISAEKRSSASGRGVGPSSSQFSFKRSLGTSVGGLKDAHGRPLTQKVRSHYSHLGWMMRREVTRSSQWRGGSSEASEIISRASTHMMLPPVVRDEAEHIFQEGAVRGLFRGRSLNASAGAALYAACRRYRLPHTLVEVSVAMGIRRWEIGRAFKTLNRGLSSKVPVVSLGAYLKRYSEELALSPAVRSTVEEMLDVASKRPEVSGVSPHGLVAALIYIASEQHGEKKTRGEIARLGSVTEMTLRTTTKLVERLLKETPSQTA
jgi:transcription initiation factor TFIIB